MYRSNSGSRQKLSNDGYMNAGGDSSYLEQENERMVGNLSSKVSNLKSLTIDIGHEVKKQNEFLTGMDSDFDNTGGLLGSTMRRLGIVSASGGHRFICYLVGFAFVVFLIIYYLVR